MDVASAAPEAVRELILPMPDLATPWKILGLEPAAATAESLVAAYHRRQETREVDFEVDAQEQLRTAYELARLELDLKVGRPTWDVVIAASAEDESPQPDPETADPKALVLALSRGAVNQAEATLRAWEQASKTTQLGKFQTALQEQGAAFGSPSAAAHLARLAIESGLFVPRLARRMATVAALALAPSAKEALIASMERSIALGSTFQVLHPSQRQFWFDRLRHSGPAWDWSSAESVESREYLQQTAPDEWLGWSLVAAMTPPHWLQQRQERQIPVPKRLKEKAEASSDSFWEIEDEELSASAGRAASPALAPSAAPKPSEHSPQKRKARTVTVNVKPRQTKPGFFHWVAKAYRQGDLGGLLLILVTIGLVVVLFIWLLVSTSG